MKSKWFRRMLAGALSAAFCCGMLTGCGKGVEQTNTELNLYVTENGYGSVIQAIRYFRQKYPDIVLNENIIQEADMETYYDSLSGSLMTGKNIPDIVIVDYNFMEYCDIYKMEQAGGFIDLNTLISEDVEFDASKYNAGVVNGLQYKENQYLYPIAYSLPYVMSTEENLMELGITKEQFQSLNVLEFFELVNRKTEELGLSVDEVVSGILNTERQHINLLYPNWYLPQTVDFAEQTFSLDTGKMLTLIENMRVLQDSTPDTSNMTALMYAVPVFNENCVQRYTKNALDSDETPVLSCLTDMDGNINAAVWLAAAIPVLSPNQQNAYLFLKSLLAEEVQSYHYDGIGVGFTGLDTQVLVGGNHFWVKAPYAYKEYQPIRKQDLAYQGKITGSFLYSEWSGLLMDKAKQYYAGNCTAEQALEDAEKKLKIYVSE